MRPPPHYPRIRRRIESLSAPLIQLWGWPGTGKRALLAALAEAEPERSRVLAEAVVRQPERLEATMETARGDGVRWFLCEGTGFDDLVAVLERLHPDESAVVATPIFLRHRILRSSSAIAPSELLLLESEARGVWRSLAGGEPEAELGSRLLEACDGWLRPLELVARSAANGDGDWPGDPLELSEVTAFLRSEVIAPLKRRELESLAAFAGAGGGKALPQQLESLFRRRGLLLEQERGLRLPRLLRDLLRADAERLRPPSAQPAAADGEATAGGGELVVGVLGAPRLARVLADGSEQELRWKLRRAFLLLAYLATSPGLQAERDELMEAVWPDADEGQIRRNFHPTVSLLRRTLEGPGSQGPPPLLLKSGVYRLNPELKWRVDALEFQERVAAGRLERDDPTRSVEEWQAAWGLYGGHLLPGHDQPWVRSRREELKRLYLETLRDLGDAYLKTGRAEKAEDAYRSLLIEDPVQEGVHLSIMRIYAERGRRDLVRRQYERLCQLLMAELGVEPMTSTAAEYQRLMAEEGSGAVPA